MDKTAVFQSSGYRPEPARLLLDSCGIDYRHHQGVNGITLAKGLHCIKAYPVVCVITRKERGGNGHVCNLL
ncbi:hypothetical protein YM18_1362 [Geobacter sulfurreducens]|nr:hypothetical protein YM18_1362 [Geobacter sulfurreducens]